MCVVLVGGAAVLQGRGGRFEPAATKKRNMHGFRAHRVNTDQEHFSVRPIRADDTLLKAIC